jgi:hypothetical protein
MGRAGATAAGAPAAVAAIAKARTSRKVGHLQAAFAADRTLDRHGRVAEQHTCIQ